MVKKVVVFGFGNRGGVVARIAKANPDKFELVAFIENNDKRIAFAKQAYPEVKLFTSYLDFIDSKIEADIVAVCTQDEGHREHAVAMMKAGYDLLLEKPIANNKKDCLEIYKASKKYNRKVIVCHVLRYTPFYSTIKEIIDSGKLGEIVNMRTSENVGYYHQAHSFVRGPWRNKKESSPMILAKCCHDMDIITYLLGEKCLSVSSFGGLKVFNRANAPEGSAEYCSDCKIKDCKYNAEKLYVAPESRWCASYFLAGDPTDEEILKALPHNQYDRCVYKCDNDVVDHQVVIMNFANGKTVMHSMTAFSKHTYRDIFINGTNAELFGNAENNLIEIRYYGKDTETVKIDTEKASKSGHMGGDYYMMMSLYEALNGKDAPGISYLDVSVQSHLMSFAAEESRLKNGKPIKIKK